MKKLTVDVDRCQINMEPAGEPVLIQHQYGIDDHHQLNECWNMCVSISQTVILRSNINEFGLK